MLKRFFLKKTILILALVFSIFLITLIPNDSVNLNQELVYVDNNVSKSAVYLIDSNNYVARTTVALTDRKIEAKAKELIEVLIKDGKGESKIPNGFNALIPSDTKINSISYEDGLIKIDFSEELLNTKEEYEEKIIEAIVYTLTSIDGVDKIIIYVDGDILSYLPQSKITLPSTLDKSYGINKKYDVSTYNDINKVIVYYVSKYNDEEYYVPVTKYVNDDRDKIKIIIDSLSSSNISNPNLMSFLNSNTVLLSSELNDEALSLVFNEYIFNDFALRNILEEVIYTINLSIEANYNVKEVSFNVDNEEIYRSVLKNT